MFSKVVHLPLRRGHRPSITLSNELFPHPLSPFINVLRPDTTCILNSASINNRTKTSVSIALVYNCFVWTSPCNIYIVFVLLLPRTSTLQMCRMFTFDQWSCLAWNTICNLFKPECSLLSITVYHSPVIIPSKWMSLKSYFFYFISIHILNHIY